MTYKIEWNPNKTEGVGVRHHSFGQKIANFFIAIKDIFTCNRGHAARIDRQLDKGVNEAIKDSVHYATAQKSQNEAIKGGMPYANAQDPQQRANSIKQTSVNIDALYARFPKVAQPCFLVSQFVKSGSSVEAFQPSATLLTIAQSGKQIDMGAVFSGKETTENIGKFSATIYSAENKETGMTKNSLVIRGTEKDFKMNAAEIRTNLKEKYPEGCLLKTGGGAGHYAFYDTKNDIVYSGGMKALSEGVSGVTLDKYISAKMNGAIETNKETISATDCTADDILSIGYEAVKGLGISYEDWLTWE